MFKRCLIVCSSVSVLAAFVSTDAKAMMEEERDSSPAVLQKPSVRQGKMSTENFLVMCGSLLERGLVPARFQKEAQECVALLSNQDSRRHIDLITPAKAVLQRSLISDVQMDGKGARYQAIQQMMTSGDLFAKTLTALKIIYDDTESIKLRLEMVRLLRNCKDRAQRPALPFAEMKRVMMDLLENIFETQYQQGKLHSCHPVLVGDIMAHVFYFPRENGLRTKVLDRLASIPHIDDAFRFYIFSHVDVGPERDGRILPFLENHELKLDPSLRLSGILSLSNTNKREELLREMLKNPRVPMGERLEALRLSQLSYGEKREFLEICLDHKARFPKEIQDKMRGMMHFLEVSDHKLTLFQIIYHLSSPQELRNIAYQELLAIEEEEEEMSERDAALAKFEKTKKEMQDSAQNLSLRESVPPSKIKRIIPETRNIRRPMISNKF